MEKPSPVMQKAKEGEEPMDMERLLEFGSAVFPSASLFKGRREIVIEHNGEFYRLRITRQGKLILNK